jgi:hypothetical protein
MLLIGVGIMILMRRSRKETRVDRTLRPIAEAIDRSDLPDRLKDVLLTAVSEVRDAGNTLGEAAGELRNRG